MIACRVAHAAVADFCAILLWTIERARDTVEPTGDSLNSGGTNRADLNIVVLELNVARGRREDARRTEGDSSSPTLRGEEGLLAWQPAMAP